HGCPGVCGDRRAVGVQRGRSEDLRRREGGRVAHVRAADRVSHTSHAAFHVASLRRTRGRASEDGSDQPDQEGGAQEGSPERQHLGPRARGAVVLGREKAMQTEFETLIVKIDGPICEVILNRPEARNAWNAQMHADYDHVLDEAADDASIKVVTLRGAGRIFSAGHDLKEVAEGYSTVGKPSGWDPHRTPQLHHSSD